MQNKKRCDWVTTDQVYIDYHDKEWGRPIYDDQILFEFLILEGAQAGLSWLTILKRRENYMAAFDNFTPSIIAEYTQDQVESLLENKGIIRNRLKVESAISNANIFLQIQRTHGSFKDFLWAYVDGRPIINHWKDSSEVPVTTEISDKLAKDLKKLGFKFVGSTICYAYMQAIGMVNDHTQGCYLAKV